jgi:kynurenine formamidase
VLSSHLPFESRIAAMHAPSFVRLVVGAALLVLFSSPSQSAPREPAARSLSAAYEAIHASRFVDLTHTFAPGIPHWKGFGDEVVEMPYSEAKDGFTAQIFTHVGQWGTHVDPPAHFHQNLKTVDQIDPREFLLRLVVLDIHAQVASNADYVVTMADVKAWETKHGLVPKGAFIALRTDWSKRWPDADAFNNRDKDGVTHYPGWSMPVLKYLYEVRGAIASGHETSDTDPGIQAFKDDFSLESYILGLNHFQIEFMTNLDQVPESGALIMVSFPKPEKGYGFPARVVAIVPK